MQIKSLLSRQAFLKQISLAAAGTFTAPLVIPSHILSTPPSEKIIIGCIGLGGQGTYNLQAFLNTNRAHIVALCDVNDGSDDYDMLYQFPGTTAGLLPAKARAEAYYARKYGKGAYTGIATYSDFRDLLAREDIDAVTVCTPDHWHGLVSIAAAKAGKDIYCEKPLTNSIAEGMALREAVRKHNVVLQTGSHERSNDTVRFAAELVRNGYIGPLHTIRVHMPNSDPHHLHILQDTSSHHPRPVPAGFDYNFWLGHTPEIPYTKQRCHFWWRFNLNYGGGEMTDRGAHIIDLGQLVNDTDDSGPVEFRGTGETPDHTLYDTFMSYQFEATYANGVKLIGDSQSPRGLRLEGEDGWIFIHIHGGRLEADPASLLRVRNKPDEEHLGRSPGHHQNFLDSVITRKDPMATVEIGHRTATICHLLNIAILVNRPLTWNPDTEEITNDPEAQRMLTQPMRSPWTLT